MESSGFIDLKGDARDYSKFLLEHNPFPSLPIPQGIPTITSDRVEDKKRFQDAISELIVNGSSTLTVVVGEYGSGKSHLFRIFKQNVNSQLLSGKEGTMAVYVKTPGNDFSYLFSAFVDDMGEAMLREYAKRAIAQFIDENHSEIPALIHDPTIASQFRSGKYEIEEL